MFSPIEITVERYVDMREKFEAVLEQAFPLPDDFCRCGCDPRHHEVIWLPTPNEPAPGSGRRAIVCRTHGRHFYKQGCARLPRFEDLPREFEHILNRVFKDHGKRR